MNIISFQISKKFDSTLVRKIIVLLLSLVVVLAVIGLVTNLNKQKKVSENSQEIEVDIQSSTTSESNVSESLISSVSVENNEVFSNEEVIKSLSSPEGNDGVITEDEQKEILKSVSVE